MGEIGRERTGGFGSNDSYSGHSSQTQARLLWRIPRSCLKRLCKFHKFCTSAETLKNKGLPRCRIWGHNESRFPLARQGALWYNSLMNYVAPEKPIPESIAASLARSEAQIAAGQTVPLEPVFDRLRASIARMRPA